MTLSGTELARAQGRLALAWDEGKHDIRQWMRTRGANQGHYVREGLEPLYAYLDRIRAGEQVWALVAAPPRVSKTTTIFHGATREMQLNDGFKYGYVTYSVEAARQKSKDMHDLARDAGLWVTDVREQRTGRFGRSSLSLWETNNGSSARFVGLKGGASIGAGVDWLHIDDPFNVDDARSLAVLESRWNELLVMITRIEPGGILTVSHHRWTPDDPIGRLLDQVESGYAGASDDVRELAQKREWEFIELPAYDGPTTEGEPVPDLDDWKRIDMRTAKPLVDGWYDMKQLAAFRATQGDEQFGALYMQAPTKGGVIFPSAWPMWQPQPEARLMIGDLEIEVPDLTGKYLVLGADTAGSVAATADYTALVLGAFWWQWFDDIEAWLLYEDILWAWYERVDSTAVVDFVGKIGRSLPMAMIGYEAAGVGNAQLDFLARDYPDLTIERLKTVASKRARAMPFGNASKGLRVRTPAKAPWLPEWRRQTKRFTGLGGPTKDDLPDAGAHAWNLASQQQPTAPPMSGADRKMRSGLGSF